MNKKLNNLYYNPSLPGSFSGLSSFKRHIDKKIPLRDVKNFLLDQETYTLHKPARKKFNRNRIIVTGIDDTWQADLIDLQNISNENDGFKYLLCVIDVFSKYAWVVVLKNKTNLSIIKAFQKIFKKRKPKRIHTDQGKEFLGKDTQKFFKQNAIQYYILNSEVKAPVVERFNRTLKEKMWRYFTKFNNHKYIDVIDKFLNSYNNTYHRSIKMRPNDVSEKNEQEVFLNLYAEFDYKNLRKIQINFKVGDLVRISKNKRTFEKSYTPNWTEEIFIISEVCIRRIPVYKIKDQLGEEILGVFYDWELQKVFKSDKTLKIERILKTRNNKQNEVEYFVKWKGYPQKFNSWINSDEIQ